MELISIQNIIYILYAYSVLIFQEHPTHSKVVQSAKERATFSLEGPGKEKERRTIYCFMLENMMDDQRLRISYQICTDVLGMLIIKKINCVLEILEEKNSLIKTIRRL